MKVDVKKIDEQVAKLRRQLNITCIDEISSDRHKEREQIIKQENERLRQNLKS